MLEYMKEFGDLHCAYVIFVSNMNKSVGLFAQIKGDSQMDHFVIWDYHVFIIYNTMSGYLVYDFDSLLPFPSPFDYYFAHGLRQNDILPERLRRFYRVIHGTDYVNHFSSDRSHMQRQDGSWIAPPPSYGCICGHNSSSSHNLPFYLDMTMNVVGENSLITDGVYGTVLNENEFFEKFSDL
uniref:Protein N-terminal glutamine amidohydrolase n=1 Tax=Schistosoma japonicum TaxID=6182 RepID=Q86EC2_SCHJA|nr:similar to GenBank Accession Number AY060439 CG8253 gene product in Drosophila melanogaster [Schistosoma japonicum]